MAAIILLRNKKVVQVLSGSSLVIRTCTYVYMRYTNCCDALELGTFIRVDSTKIPVPVRILIDGSRTPVGFSSIVVDILDKLESTTVV